MSGDIGFLIQIGANLREYHAAIDKSTAKVVSHYATLISEQRKKMAEFKKSVAGEINMINGRHQKETQTIKLEQATRLNQARAFYMRDVKVWEEAQRRKLNSVRQTMQKFSHINKKAFLDVMEAATADHRITMRQIMATAKRKKWSVEETIRAQTKEEFNLKRINVEALRDIQKREHLKKNEHSKDMQRLRFRRREIQEQYREQQSTINQLAAINLQKSKLQKTASTLEARMRLSGLEHEKVVLKELTAQHTHSSRKRRENLKSVEKSIRDNIREIGRAKKVEAAAAKSSISWSKLRSAGFKAISMSLRAIGRSAAYTGRRVTSLGSAFRRLATEQHHFGRLGFDVMSMLGMQHSMIGRLITSLTMMIGVYFGLYGVIRLVTTAFENFREGAQVYNESMGRLLAVSKGDIRGSAKGYTKALELSLTTPFTIKEVITSEIDLQNRAAAAMEKFSGLDRMEGIKGKPYIIEVIGNLATAFNKPMQRAMFSVMDAVVEQQWMSFRRTFSTSRAFMNRRMSNIYSTPGGKKVMDEILNGEQWVGGIDKVTTATKRLKLVVTGLQDAFGGTMGIIGKQFDARFKNLKAGLQLLWGQVGSGAKLLEHDYIDPETGKVAIDPKKAKGTGKKHLGFWDYLTEDIGNALMFIRQSQGVLGLLTDQFAKGGVTIYHHVTSMLNNTFGSFKTGFMNMLGVAQQGTDELYETVILPFIVSLEIWRRHIVNFWGNFTQGFSAGWGTVKKVFGATISEVGDVFSAAFPEKGAQINDKKSFFNTMVLSPLEKALKAMTGMDVHIKRLKTNQDVLEGTAKALGLIASILVTKGLLKLVLGMSGGVLGIIFKPLTFVVGVLLAIGGAALAITAALIKLAPAAALLALPFVKILLITAAIIEAVVSLGALIHTGIDLIKSIFSGIAVEYFISKIYTKISAGFFGLLSGISDKWDQFWDDNYIKSVRKVYADHSINKAEKDVRIKKINREWKEKNPNIWDKQKLREEQKFTAWKDSTGLNFDIEAQFKVRRQQQINMLGDYGARAVARGGTASKFLTEGIFDASKDIYDKMAAPEVLKSFGKQLLTELGISDDIDRYTAQLEAFKGVSKDVVGALKESEFSKDLTEIIQQLIEALKSNSDSLTIKRPGVRRDLEQNAIISDLDYILHEEK